MLDLKMDPYFVQKVKLWIRGLSIGNVLDEEIWQDVLACCADLKIAGVVKTDLDDPLIQQAVKLYCKAHFGYEEDSEKFQRAYDSLKASLSLSGDYNGLGDSGG